jgi:hypothetical protein
MQDFGSGDGSSNLPGGICIIYQIFQFSDFCFEFGEVGRDIGIRFWLFNLVVQNDQERG